MRILLWGSGQMARHFSLGLKSHSKGAWHFLCHNPSAEKAQALAQELGGRVFAAGMSVDVVVLGFKPQKLSEAAAQLAGLAPGKLVVSLLAAVEHETLRAHFPQSEILRAMPNLSVALRQGVVLWNGEGLSAQHRAVWSEALSSLGLAREMSDAEIDLYTLVSGCAPAYLYALIQELGAGLAALGADPALARELLLKSFAGALAGSRGEEDLTEKISQVASKGGVTEAVLAELWPALQKTAAPALAKGLARTRALKGR